MKRWLWLAIPWAAFLALAIGWIAYWNVLANGARERVSAWLAQEQARGALTSIGRIEARGFPVLLRLDMRDIAYAPAQGGWRLAAQSGTLHVQMFNPRHVIFEAGAPIQFARDGGDVTSISADALIVSVRTAGGALAQAGIEADNLVLDDPAEAGVLSARKLVLNLRPDPRASGHMQVALDIEALGLPRPVRSFEALGQTLEALQAAVVIEQAQALLQSAPNDPLAPWRSGDGRVRFEALNVNWGPLRTTGQGVVRLDEQRRLAGALTLPIEEPAALFRALAGGADMNEDARRTLTLLSAAFARSERGLTLDVDAQNGVLRLEGLRVRELPSVY
jgi:hypothetical protein